MTAWPAWAPSSSRAALFPSSALTLRDSQASVTATASGGISLVAGRCTGGFRSSFTAVLACVVSDSALVLSPDVVLSTEFGEPPIRSYGAATTTVLPVPGLSAQGGTLGGTLTATFASTPGDPYVLLLGLPADPIWLLGNLLFLDPGTTVALAQATQGPAGATVTTVGVPAVPPAAKGRP